MFPSHSPSVGQLALATALGALVGGSVANVWADRRAAARRGLGSTVTLDGLSLRVEERGAGSPVLFVHGNGAMIEDILLSGLADRLSGAHRLVIPDRPGYGQSEMPASRPWRVRRHATLLLRLMERRGLERPVVVGHSLGALVALALALDHPERVGGLVLVSGYYEPIPQPSIVMQKPLGHQLLGPALVSTLAPPMAQAAFPAISRKLFAPLPVPARFAEGFPVEVALTRKHLQATGDGAALLLDDAAFFWPRAHELSVPLHLFAGEGDEIIAAARHAKALHERVPGSRLTLLPGTGHMAHYSATDAIAEAIGALAAPQ